MESPLQSPVTYDYPSRSYPYPHVNLSNAHTTPTCLPPAPPPTATTPALGVGEYFFPFAAHSQDSEGCITSPRTLHSLSGPPQKTLPDLDTEFPSQVYPPMPRRSSFNYVHDLAEFSHLDPGLRESSAEEESSAAEEQVDQEQGDQEEAKPGKTTPPTTPTRHRPHPLSLRNYLPLGRLPLVRPTERNPYESDSAIDEEESYIPLTHKTTSSKLANVHTPPESPQEKSQAKHHKRHHRRHHTVPKAPGPGPQVASGTCSHNCFNREDMKHLQHVRLLVGEAVEAFIVAGEDRRRRRDSFGGQGFGFTVTPCRATFNV